MIDSLRVTPNRIRRGLDTPALFGREANRLWHMRLGRRQYNPAGIDLFRADWDTLAVADACRYDTFAECHDLPGRLESRQSRGSSTFEWLVANFSGDHRDTVYVTANPQYERNRERLDIEFCDVIDIGARGGWDEEFRTVRPEVVTDAALEAAEEYPHKRLLVHYIQPHYPFIGPTGRKHFDGQSLDFWGRVMAGEVAVSDETLRTANRENVEVLLPELQRLLDGRAGRTVVTADHGQMLGDRSFPFPIREYGHPRSTYVDELVRVPWLIYEHGERPAITTSEATSTNHQTEEGVDERLKALGYAE